MNHVNPPSPDKPYNQRELRAIYENRASEKIATDWLNFAADCLARDMFPVRINLTATEHAADSFRIGQIMGAFKFSAASRDRIAKNACGYAITLLRAGQYPTVSAYFRLPPSVITGMGCPYATLKSKN